MLFASHLKGVFIPILIQVEKPFLPFPNWIEKKSHKGTKTSVL